MMMSYFTRAPKKSVRMATLKEEEPKPVLRDTKILDFFRNVQQKNPANPGPSRWILTARRRITSSGNQHPNTNLTRFLPHLLKFHPALENHKQLVML